MTLLEGIKFADILANGTGMVLLIVHELGSQIWPVFGGGQSLQVPVILGS